MGQCLGAYLVSKRGEEELTDSLNVVAVDPMAVSRGHTAAESRKCPSSLTAAGSTSSVAGTNGVGDRGKSHPIRRHV